MEDNTQTRNILLPFVEYSDWKDINSQKHILIFVAVDNFLFFFGQNSFGLMQGMTVCFNYMLN